MKTKKPAPATVTQANNTIRVTRDGSRHLKCMSPLDFEVDSQGHTVRAICEKCGVIYDANKGGSKNGR
jgi:hypothetical protein